jgi:hypothetical protein
MTHPGFGHMRASDAERERAVDVLKAAFTEGRLTQDEYADRVGQVQVSKTYGELAALTHDLPIGPFGSLPPPPGPVYPGPAYPAPAYPAPAYPGRAPTLAYPAYPPAVPYRGYPPALAQSPAAGHPPYYPPYPHGGPYPPTPFYPLSSGYAPVWGPAYAPVGAHYPRPPLAVPRQRDPLAVTSLAVALAAVTFPPAAVAAVGLGITALVRIRQTGKLGQNFAVAGIALGTLGTLFFIVFIAAALAGA